MKNKLILSQKIGAKSSQMWKCSNCREEIENKYKHCWNCGTTRPSDVAPVVRYKRIEEPTKTEKSSVPMAKVEPVIEKKVEPIIEKKAEPIKETKVEKKPEIPPVQKKNEPKPEVPVITKPIFEDNFLSSIGGAVDENPPSVIWTIIPVLLWLVITGAVGYFAFLSNQKTSNFDQQIFADGQNFNAQRSNFMFPTKALPDRKNQYKIEGNIKGKVLPLNKNNGEVAELFYGLPDDLRPTNLEEVKTVFWLECKPEEIGKGKTGAVRSRENCNTFLVDQDTAKFIGVQNFLGVSPALTNDRDNVEAVGKVLPEKYIAYLREKQDESDRSQMKDASDSPNHHYFNKSEFFYTLVLLGILAAIGIGWLVFRIKSMFSSN
ncbi:MAG: hypothetical protein K1X72_13870 [Pyrinomonadaceae bacterium]|nr:hypothetical protein [Pyrinomonadaceae bacterium]